jgi:hypothetical protein
MQAGTAWLVVTVNGLDRNGPTFLELKNQRLNAVLGALYARTLFQVSVS